MRQEGADCALTALESIASIAYTDVGSVLGNAVVSRHESQIALVALQPAKFHAADLRRATMNDAPPMRGRRSRGTSMPTVKAGRLVTIGSALLRAAGASREEADAVAVGCTNANLAGHDSHGIIAIPTYIDRIKAGHIVPGAPWTIVQESPATTVIDGHWGFGFHVNAKAMQLTIEKAKETNVAACTVFRQSHVGRLAAYPLMAIREGMIGLATADSGRSTKVVAPFGGREARLGTNPISIAVPSDLDAPLYLDMATSAVAAGKVALAAARGEQIPTGWVVDGDGKQTTDPTRLRKGGALLPLGGTEGYKGSGLAAMVEILCGLLTGLGFGVEPTGRHNDGCFMAVFNVEAFRPLADFKKEVAEFARYLKATPPAEGSPGVFYPGEVEYIREQERRKSGIDVEDATWDKLRALAGAYGLSAELDL
jgi:LDH2 family malate/lactate/ureidoglycolate dehydrogenase